MTTVAAAKSPIRSDDTVVVLFKNAGGAPVLSASHQKYKLPASAKFEVATAHLRTLLGLSSEESLFLYCQTAFAPSPDELIRDVAQCFHVGGTLILHYNTTPTWG